MALPSVLARWMLALRGQRRTGRLMVQAEGTRTFLYLKNGVPIFAEEGTAGETLGRLLVRLKLLTHEQYLEVLSKMTDALVFNEQIRFGETSVELGFLSEQRVQAALHDQVRWKVIRCFQRDEVEWTFDAGEGHVEELREFPMPIESLVMVAVSWLDHERRLELDLGRVLDKFVLVPEADRASLGRALELDEPQTAALSVFAGQRRTRDLLEQAPDTGFDLEALLTTLAMLRLASFSDRPATAVEPAPDAPRPAMPSTPQAAAKQQPVIDRMRTSQALRRLDSVVRQFKTHDADLFREPSSPHEQALLAEQAFQRGRDHLRGGRTSPASLTLRRAVQLAPDNHEYALFALWCDLKDKAATDLTAAGLLKRTALAGTKRDPNFAFAYYVIGVIAFGAQDHPSARRALSRAFALDPTLTDAQRHLRLLQTRT